MLSLRPPDKKSCHCLCNVGRILHEMMHSLGFYHEHTRPDRDKYIQIVQNNVKKGLCSQLKCVIVKHYKSLCITRSEDKQYIYIFKK